MASSTSNDTLCPETTQALREIWQEFDVLVKTPETSDETVDLQQLNNADNTLFSKLTDHDNELQDTTLAFDRLVTLHDKLTNIQESLHQFVTNPKTEKGMMFAMAGGVAALVYAVAQGELSLPFRGESHSLKEMFTEHPFASTAILGSTAMIASQAVLESLDRGYASMMGLQDALGRLQDGADPNSESLIQRLSNSEQQAYSGVMKHLYSILHSQDYNQSQVFMQKVNNGISSLVDDLQGSKRASAIQDFLNELEDRLENIATFERETQAAPQAPGMA